DAINWQTLGDIPGAGTSAEGTTYQFTDHAPNKRNYYRLIQEDFDGAQTVSEIVFVAFDNEERNKMVIYPNPVSKQLHVLADHIEALEVFDLSGKKVFNLPGPVTEEGIDLSELVAGIYILVLKSADETIRQKLIKN
ncbi:MAG: T9SS type A sorting domain-containing protein, partial [Bacteroidota bacterium]